MENNIENIIAKYLSGEASPEEKQRVMKFKAEHPGLYSQYRDVYNKNHFAQKSFDVKKAEKRLMKAISSHKITLSFALKAAAVFAGLMVIAASLWLLNKNNSVVYSNTTAQTMHVVLPDNTEAILGQNTVLSYTKGIFGDFHRNVSMKGKIFFHVTKDAKHPFTVNGERVKVTVLGTRFTVNELSGHTQVFLTEGKVRISTQEKDNGIVINNPGEQVLVNDKGIYKHNRVNEKLYASWTQKKLFFDKCTVKELIDFLQDSYGLTVSIDNGDVLQKKLYGSAPSDDPRLIIKALSQITHSNLEVK